jgi:integrase
MHRRRHQKGSLIKQDGYWHAQWWEDGHRRKRSLGKVSKMTKAKAQEELAAILAPINARGATPSAVCQFGDFVDGNYFPFYKRKWKRTTAAENKSRIKCHLIPIFESRTLGSISRDELQDFLEEKTGAELSYSVVAHLRWDLNQIFKMAVSEGFLQRNPAELLFIPGGARRPVRRVMTIEEVQTCLSVLELRELLIVKLAIFVGMRPGEIFGLKWGSLRGVYADISQRVYRGDIDTPKTVHSVRKAALSESVLKDIQAWMAAHPNTSDDGWVFPSETLKTPVSKDNAWRRTIAPKLAAAGLDWVDFHVFRRTHSTLMNEMGVEGKLVSDQLGHTLDVNQNTYTMASVERRKVVVDRLEQSIMKSPAVQEQVVM